MKGIPSAHSEFELVTIAAKTFRTLDHPKRSPGKQRRTRYREGLPCRGQPRLTRRALFDFSILAEPKETKRRERKRWLTVQATLRSGDVGEANWTGGPVYFVFFALCLFRGGHCSFFEGGEGGEESNLTPMSGKMEKSYFSRFRIVHAKL